MRGEILDNDILALDFVSKQTLSNIHKHLLDLILLYYHFLAEYV